ncbi:glycosyltransferase [Paenarthrobacter sp. NPDC018779]|uniref:glycosyltransferase n=1 Tax=Paenarthrobacter sp. NPDC018779 TaxID=3364375 RepID=UPI0037C4F6DF
MRILMVAPGTRGDVAPMAGLGSALQEHGFEVSIAANPAYGPLVVSAGCEYRALPGDLTSIIQRTDSAEKPSLKDVRRSWQALGGYMEQAARGTLAAAEAGADVILANSVAPFAYDIAEALEVPAIGAHLQPVEPSVAYPPVLLGSGRDLGAVGNKVIGRRVLAGPAPYDAPGARLRRGLGLPKLSRQAADRRRRRNRATTLHGISPTVLPRPKDWHAGLVMAGYWWPPGQRNWQPDRALADFLAAGPAPVFIGFGSGAAVDVELALEAARIAGVRAVIQGGRVQSDDAIGIGEVPHEWLFPRMAAVVHHAGSGTTAAGLRAGVPAVCVPVFTDQPLWASRVAALGAGPEPIPYKQLTAERLGQAMKAAVSTPSYAARARHLAAAIAKEDAVSPVLATLRNLPSRGQLTSYSALGGTLAVP